ncbi:MAG: terpene cyclase/mutase family protein [Planctomycetes bacterium]|nr:terpene cyclase/mutase family protein [Planctomycetota bacterium]
MLPKFALTLCASALCAPALAQAPDEGLDLNAGTVRLLGNGELRLLDVSVRLGSWTLSSRTARRQRGVLLFEDQVTLAPPDGPVKVHCTVAEAKLERGRLTVSAAQPQLVGVQREGHNVRLVGERLSVVFAGDEPHVTVFAALESGADASAALPRVDLSWSAGKLALRPEGLTAETPASADPAPAPVADTPLARALTWLAEHQSRDGRWSSDGWQAGCGRGRGLERCRGEGQERGDARYDVGLTGLALLAFARGGHTSSAGVYSSNVRRAVQWLQKQQLADGSLGFEGGHGESVYNHALAAQALCELYGAGDAALRASAESAIDFVVASQNPGLGWKYGIRRGRNDTSVTGFMVHALLAGRAAGIRIPDEALAGARTWFLRATDKAGTVGYESPGGGSSYLAQNDGKFESLPTMTAVSLASRIRTGDTLQAEGIAPGAKQLVANLPSWDDPRRRNFYYWYYGTEAARELGGPTWAKWRDTLTAALAPHQRAGGCADGSWDPAGEWCLAGGRVYATALNALTLRLAQEK